MPTDIRVKANMQPWTSNKHFWKLSSDEFVATNKVCIVDGKSIFYKLPEHLSLYWNRWNCARRTELATANNIKELKAIAPLLRLQVPRSIIPQVDPIEAGKIPNPLRQVDLVRPNVLLLSRNDLRNQLLSHEQDHGEGPVRKWKSMDLIMVVPGGLVGFVSTNNVPEQGSHLCAQTTWRKTRNVSEWGSDFWAQTNWWKTHEY
ncbi:hypothetical protein BC830DRAFT_1081495 [Chytriomyces sp. MP71]|nr:hypothetical protein BC830DRAFT_1081495 [Chytriomyces sp. MP71]